MIFKDIQRSFRRSSLFMTINVAGLAIGLAISIMLILFVIHELSFDRHFKDSDRIIRLNTAWNEGGHVDIIPIATYSAVTELPMKVPGIEAAVSIYNMERRLLTYEKEYFKNIRQFATEPSFFDVFDIEFVEGTKEVLDNPNTVVITNRYAKIIFGSTQNAMGKKIEMNDVEYVVSAVVKELPINTHFHFDVLTDFNYFKDWQSIEFFTYYKIAEGQSVPEVSKAIEDAYTAQMDMFMGGMEVKATGVTEKMTDIYLHTKSTAGALGESSDIKFVWLLSIIALLILLLAITNFINLFIVQGDTRIVEIGIRKSNGADQKNIITQFFAEIGATVFIAFVIALGLAFIFLPYFAQLIDRNLDLSQFINPIFILCLLSVLVVTIILSASYPSFYLAKFSSIDTLMKRIRFSRQRLVACIVIFQSIISIVLLSYILVVKKQTAYLENIPIGYNPKGVMHVYLNDLAKKEYNTIKQELLRNPKVKAVNTGNHVFGAGYSGQTIRLINDPLDKGIMEYRIDWGVCEMMELELREGEFYKEDSPKNEKGIILNEAAVKLLGLNYPVVGTNVIYKAHVDEPLEVIGVVKDFIFGEPQDGVGAIALKFYDIVFPNLYIKFADEVTRAEARKITNEAFHSVDSEFLISPFWSEDIYNSKFSTLKTQSTILSYAAVLSILISMLGLLGIHTFTTIRRTKEIAVRRVNGATASTIFKLLSVDICKWILLAGIIAIPIVYYISTNWLENYYNRTSLGLEIFIIPILLQLIVALVTTSGVTLKVSTQNPVESLKSE